MDARWKIIFMSYAVVNFYYINHFKTIAPCNYYKHGDHVYISL